MGATRRMHWPTLLVALAVLQATPAPGDITGVHGRLLRIVNLHGGTGTRRSISIRVVAYLDVAPDLGDLKKGATLRVFANGATSTSQVFDLPGGVAPGRDGPAWSGHARTSRARSVTHYTYEDPRARAGLVRALGLVVDVRRRSTRLLLKVEIDGKGVNPDRIEVLPPNPGTDAGVVLSGEGRDGFCAAFGGAARGNVVDNDDEVFRIVNSRSAGCPGAGSPAGAFVD